MAHGRYVGQRVLEHQPRQHRARSRACHHDGSHPARPAPQRGTLPTRELVLQPGPLVRGRAAARARGEVVGRAPGVTRAGGRRVRPHCERLAAGYSGSDIGRVTNGAARAMLAKVYLTRQDWANAAQTAGQLIATNRYTLLPNWRDCFKISTEIINSESIFEINYDGLLDPGAGSVHTLFSLPSGFPGGDAYGLMTVAPSLANLFAASDT